ncbi:g8372 [Coccomyxa viridis]|uniref:G8372 protein n=1 Tax=Coccomyxa viridis TaxID=1274662 RepID=A0ABP1G2M8_9CHLO
MRKDYKFPGSSPAARQAVLKRKLVSRICLVLASMGVQGTLLFLLCSVLSLQHIHGYDIPGLQLPLLGKILVSEGSNGTTQLVSSELYSPLLNLWTAAGNQQVQRTGFTDNPNNGDHAQAVRLADGRVLSFGGVNPENAAPLASCEAYSILTNSWTTCPSLLTPRGSFQAVLLHDGKILAIGGIGPNHTFLASTELYSATTNAWAPAGALAEGRVGFLAVILHDGQVLVTGGSVTSGLGNSAELYNVLNNTWTAAAPMAGSHGGGSAVVLSDGNVLVMGGYDYGTHIPSTELYNPAENTWAPAANMTTRRVQFQTMMLLDGRVMVMGGYDHDVSLSSCEIYDPTANTWTPVADMSAKRAAFQAMLLKDGSVIALGGAAAHFDSPAVASVEVYDVKTNTWHALAPMSTPRVGMQAIML